MISETSESTVLYFSPNKKEKKVQEQRKKKAWERKDTFNFEQFLLLFFHHLCNTFLLFSVIFMSGCEFINPDNMLNNEDLHTNRISVALKVLIQGKEKPWYH